MFGFDKIQKMGKEIAEQKKGGISVWDVLRTPDPGGICPEYKLYMRCLLSCSEVIEQYIEAVALQIPLGGFREVMDCTKNCPLGKKLFEEAKEMYIQAIRPEVSENYKIID